MKLFLTGVLVVSVLIIAIGTVMEIYKSVKKHTVKQTVLWILSFVIVVGVIGSVCYGIGVLMGTIGLALP